MTMQSAEQDTEVFLSHRALLFTVAYELLGSAADAEDVVQETWLRWSAVDHESIHNARAYLVQIASRQALNRLRTIARRRESYLGSWLPEPLVTEPDLAKDVELAESVSMAMLVVLETLSPVERTVFVLREVFDVDYDQIAATIERSPATTRQIARRARLHVEARKPRQAVNADETAAALASFQSALESGDLRRVVDVFTADAVLVGDGGGIKPAVLRPIIGAERVARFFIGVMQKNEGAISGTLLTVNGQPAVVVRINGETDGVITLRLDGDRIGAMYYVRNPEKLPRLETPATLSRHQATP